MDGLDTQRLPAAAGWRFSYLLVQGLSSVALFALLAQILPAGPFGAVAVAQGILVLAQAVGDFGLSQGATTALTARLGAMPARRVELLAAATATFWAGAAAAVVLVLVSSLPLAHGPAQATLIIAPAAGCAVLVAGVDGLLRAQGEFRRPVVLMALSRLGAFAAVPVAALTHSADATAAGLAGGCLAGTAPAIVLLGSLARRPAAADVRWFVHAIVPLGLAQLLVVGSARLNTLLLGSFSTVAAAAAFESGWRLYQLGQYVGGVLATASAPFVASAIGRGRPGEARRLVVRLLALASVAGVLVATALLVLRGPLAHAIYPSGRRRVEDLMPWFALATPFGLVGQIALVTLSATDRERRLIPVAFLLGAIVNLTWVALAIDSSGALAAAGAASVAAVVTNAVLIALAFTRVVSPSRRAAPTPREPRALA
jgi:O-antigen/teichoic acid export membrane protein